MRLKVVAAIDDNAAANPHNEQRSVLRAVYLLSDTMERGLAVLVRQNTPGVRLSRSPKRDPYFIYFVPVEFFDPELLSFFPLLAVLRRRTRNDITEEVHISAGEPASE